MIFPSQILERKRKSGYFEMEVADFYIVYKWITAYTEPGLLEIVKIVRYSSLSFYIYFSTFSVILLMSSPHKLSSITLNSTSRYIYVLV